MPEPPLVMIVAGEASADLHAAALVGQVNKLDPSISFYGAGGPAMQAEGVSLLSDFASRGIVGIAEVLPHAKFYINTFRDLLKSVQQRKPDLVVLLDLPDFNMFLAKKIKAHSPATRILYYISPQVWAWRSGRVKTLARLVDKMLVILPFEQLLYKDAGLDVEFVGHPLRDTVKPSASRGEIRLRFGIDSAAKVVALLPGSRREEVNRYVPRMIGACKLMQKQQPVSFTFAVAPTLNEQRIRAMFEDAGLEVMMQKDATYDVLACADAAVIGSGTATLEAAILETPMVILGASSRLNYIIGRLLTKIDRLGLPNIVAGRDVVPELIQDQITPQNIADKILTMLDDPEYARAMKQDLASVRQMLGPHGASAKAALAVVDFLNQRA